MLNRILKERIDALKDPSDKEEKVTGHIAKRILKDMEKTHIIVDQTPAQHVHQANVNKLT